MITEQVRTKNVVHGRRSKVKEESFYFMQVIIKTEQNKSKPSPRETFIIRKVRGMKLLL